MPPSGWFLLVCSLGAIGVAIAKRYTELAGLGGAAIRHRPVLRWYRPAMLRLSQYLVAMLMVVAYLMWASGERAGARDWHLASALPLAAALIPFGVLTARRTVTPVEDIIFTTDVHDERIMGEVIAHLRAHRPQLGPSQIVAEPVSSIGELMRQIASVDAVVASRFHNVLCALMLAKPTLSVGYAAKFEVLMEEVGLAEFCQSARSVDVDRLIEQFTELESRSAQLQQMIMERTAVNARLLNHQFATLSALLFRSAEPEDAVGGHEHTRTDPFLGEVL